MALINLLDRLNPDEQVDASLDLSDIVTELWFEGHTPYLPVRSGPEGQTIRYRLGNLEPPPDAAIICEHQAAAVEALAPGNPIFLAGELEGLTLRGGSWHAFGPVVLAEVAHRCRFEDMRILDPHGTVFLFDVVDDVLFRDVEMSFESAGIGTAVRALQGRRLAMLQCKVKAMTQGLLLGEEAGVDAVELRGCWFEGLRDSVVVAHGGTTLAILDSYFEHVGTDGFADVVLNPGSDAELVTATISGCAFNDGPSRKPARVLHGENVSLTAHDNFVDLSIELQMQDNVFVDSITSLSGVAIWLHRNRLRAFYSPNECQSQHPSASHTCIDVIPHPRSQNAGSCMAGC